MKKILGLTIAMILIISMTALGSAAKVPAIVKTDRFDVLETEGGLSMISRDGDLVILVNDSTEIIFEDGRDARESLKEIDGLTLSELLNGRNLIVSYTTATKSIPQKTTPVKIVILYEIAVPLPANVDENGFMGIEPPIYKFDSVENFPIGIEPPIYIFTPEEIEELFPLNGEIVINGEIIEAPAPYYNNGVVMVPLRAIAEALGFDVNWDEEVQGVRLGVAINLWIGKDYYTVGRMAPIELGAAPELNDVYTYVPYTFFRDVVSGYNIYTFNGQVIIEPIVNEN